MPSPFLAYDIRGRVPDDLDTGLAHAIGKAFVTLESPGAVVVGRDMRLESPALADALIAGLTEAGADVIDIGLCGTEEVYFQTAHRGVGGGIMITASHNPKGYNGMKLVREGARPISGDDGLFAIRDRIASGPLPSATGRGRVTQDADKSAYIEHLRGYVADMVCPPLRILADPGNGCAGPVIEAIAPWLAPTEIILVRAEPDGHFPNGVPNPLLPERRAATRDALLAHRADFAIAWDGDFDRCFLFGADGSFIEGYYLVGLLARILLAEYPGERILFEPRLTWNTIEEVERAGGVPVMTRTGHAFMKARMRSENALYGGEMSAHHYFRDFAFCDSGMIPWLLILRHLAQSGKTLTELVGERIQVFPCSGEINFRVDDVSSVLDGIVEFYQSAQPHIDRTDGISLEFDSWRCNIRGSNTEPLLRLNVETREDPKALTLRVGELSRLIESLASGAGNSR
jgi:phosphomannomutase/phosphoglucomutase